MTNMTNTNIEKMDFSVKSAKAFRDGLAMYHNAVFEIADQILQISDQRKAWATVKATNEDKLARLAKGESVLGDEATMKQEIVQAEEKIAQLNKDLAEFKSAQADRLDKGYALLTDELYEAYEAYVNDGVSMQEAVYTWFTAQGLTPTEHGVLLVEKACGLKKTSARQKCKDGKHLVALKQKPWRDIFLGALCDELTANKDNPIIPIYKFQYVLKNKRNKKSNK